MFNVATLIIATVIVLMVTINLHQINGQLNCVLPLPAKLKLWKLTTVQNEIALWDITKVCHNSRTCYRSEVPYNQDMLPQIPPIYSQINAILSFSSPNSGTSYYTTNEVGFQNCLYNPMDVVTNLNSVPVVKGSNYFIANSSNLPWLSCGTGQRLNVTLLGHDCKLDPVALKFCSGNGHCAVEAGESQYTCKCCQPNYGRYCEKVDGCFWYKNDCLNNGSCIDDPNDQIDKTLYKCQCPTGFMGKRCEQKNMALCPRNDCNNGGTCLISTTNNFGFVCQCPDGFLGTTCEENRNECLSGPCLNGGTCVDGVNSFTCLCSEGFSGPTCQTDYRICRPEACLNGGTCQVVNGAPSCLCPIEYSGPNCSIYTNPCDPNPCLHAVDCSLNKTAFTCHCKPGYGGKLCDMNLNTCASNPCQVGGTCVQGSTSYYCNCPDGSKGPNCIVKNETKTPIKAQESSNEAAPALSDIPPPSDTGYSTLAVVGIIFIILIVVAIMFCLIFGGWYVLRRRRRRQNYIAHIDVNSLSLNDRTNPNSAYPAEVLGDDTYPDKTEEVKFSSTMGTPLVKRNVNKDTTKI